MDSRDIDPRLTEDGRLRLQAAELDTLQELVDAGDRGAFHYLYGEMANNSDSRLTAKISTFSDTVGGTAFAANWALQRNETGYEGIYRISQQIAADVLELVRQDAESVDGGTGFLTANEHFDSAEQTWQEFGLLDLFPGNLINLIRNEEELNFLEEIADIATFLLGGASTGERAGLFGAMYSGYAGKKLSDFEGQPGYQILDVSGGKIVIDSAGRTTATFIDAPVDDILAAAAQGFTLGAAYETFANSPDILYELMGQVGDPNIISGPSSPEYVAARRDFTQYSNDAYNGDNDPDSFPAVGNPTISISQDPTNSRDLLAYGNAEEDVFGGDGDDFALGGNGNDTLRGEAGDDVLWGQFGSDFLVGGDGEDILRGGVDSDALYGGAGDDVIDGADIAVESFEPLSSDPSLNNKLLSGVDGHDLILGGTGNDFIRGGHGSDIIFDRGLNEFSSEEIDLSPENTELYAYEGGSDGTGGALGSDTITGGHGSDLLVYSGGQDSFYGGEGDDTYIVSPSFLPNQTTSDKLSIFLEEDPNDSDTYFGHDYVVGNGAGIHEIVFEGLNRSDVTFTYEYTETPFDELDGSTQTLLLQLLGIEELDLGTYPVFSLSGQLAITVNATGSSIYFDNVGGAYVGGDNDINGNIYVQPTIQTQTFAVFEDGTYFDWASQVGLEGSIKPINGTINEAADDAPDSQANERGEANTLPPYEQVGTTDTNVLIGENLSDSLEGFSGDDYLHGFEGDDTLEGGEGADYIHGGDGIDIASYESSTASVVIGLGSDNASGGDAEGDILVSIEGIRGSAFNDTFNGDNDENINIIEGLGGDDRLVTGYGSFDSFLYGGEGNDSLIVRSGSSFLDGGTGRDLLSGHFDTDLMYGGDGDDTLYASLGDDLYDGGAGYDILDSSSLFNPYDVYFVDLASGSIIELDVGSPGQGIGTNQIASIEGFIGSRAEDYVIGTDGGNLISGGFGEDSLEGNGGNDTLIGGFQDDTLVGGDGDDEMYGGFENSGTPANDGNDHFLGGNGADTVFYVSASSNFSFSVSGQTLSVTDSSGNVDQIRDDVETVTFTDDSFSWAELAAIPPNQVPVANPDSVSVIEGETINFDVRLNDTDGDGDPLQVTTVNGIAINSSQTVSVTPGLTIRMNPAGTLSVEADDPFGDDLDPGETQEIQVSYSLSDGQGGSTGSTIVVTVTGNEEPTDVILSGTEGADTINVGYVDVDGDTVNNLGQVIEACGGDDDIYDGAGDDTVSGGAGLDRFYAGAGADSYDGGADSQDEILYTRSSTGVTVDLSDTSANTGIAVGDSYLNIERLHGSHHDDLLVSGGSVTTLNGGSGDDILVDGLAKDHLLGGTGADLFVIIPGDNEQDRVLDFEVGVDQIELGGTWLVNHVDDLTIYEATDSAGAALGHLLIEFKSESLRLDGLDAGDIPALLAGGIMVLPPILGGDGIVDGTAGNDTIDPAYFDIDSDYVHDRGQQIRGLEGDDIIYDGAGDDTIDGGAGRDHFYAGAGADTYDGGSDNRDEIFYNLSTSGLTVDASDTTNNTGIADGDTYVSVERLQGSDHDDVLVAGGSVEFLHGRSGDDDHHR